jgi:hypothetical protein
MPDKSENKNPKVILRKIALKAFIDTLVNVYNSGADYVDLVGSNDEEQDTIGIIVTDEYMADPDDMELEIEDGDEDEEKKLSDDDIDQLII